MSSTGQLLLSLECPVCLQLFEKPKQLSCGHTLCAGCLDDIVTATRNKHYSFLGRVTKSLSSVSIDCPECREATSVPVAGLSTNYAILDLANKLSQLEVSDQRPCGACQKQVPVSELFRCASCEKKQAKKMLMLCAVCALRRHRGHDVRDFSKATQCGIALDADQEWINGNLVQSDVHDPAPRTYRLLDASILALATIRVLLPFCLCFVL
ncbi:Protein TAM-1 [Aphelenchoides avenae]|nr:Protein TAM-1 [Aphelenchus avenae]